MTILIENINLEIFGFPKRMENGVEKHVQNLCKTYFLDHIEQYFMNFKELDFKIEDKNWNITAKNENELKSKLQKTADKIIDEIKSVSRNIVSHSPNVKNTDIEKSLIQYFKTGTFNEGVLEKLKTSSELSFDENFLSKIGESLDFWTKETIIRLMEYFPFEILFSYFWAIKKSNSNQSLIAFFKKNQIQISNQEQVLKINKEFVIKKIQGNLRLKFLEELVVETEKQNNQNKQTTATENEKYYYSEQSGILLIHPFIEEIFETCDIIENRKIINLDKAAHLLFFASTGEDEVKNHQLSLEKIMIGLTPEKTINTSLNLTEKEKNIVEKTLEKVIKTWGIGEGNDLAFLRQMFLNRQGSITKKENSWEVEFQKEAQDILLENLPWGIGIIKFPWMKKWIDFK